MNRLERFFDRKKSATLPESSKKECSENPIEKVFVKEERNGIVLSGWKEVSDALYSLGMGDPLVFSKEDLRAKDTERHDFQLMKDDNWMGNEPWYERFFDEGDYAIELLKQPDTTKEDIDNVLHAAKSTLYWKKTWNEHLTGLGRSLHDLDVRISRIGKNKGSFLLSVDSGNFDKLPEEKLARDLGTEQAVSNIKVVLENSRNFDLKVDFDDMAKKLNSITEREGEEALTGKILSDHFIPEKPSIGRTSAYLLGNIDGFSLEIEAPGIYSDMWSLKKSRAKIREEKFDENFLPPSFEISIKDGKNELVTDPERKAKMRELANHIAGVFQPQNHQ